MFSKQPPKPVHVAGTQKGEETVRRHGREPGREEDKDVNGYRGPRDSTSINPSKMGPIDPRMPSIPPA